MTKRKDKSAGAIQPNQQLEHIKNQLSKNETEPGIDIRYHEGPLPPAEDLHAYNTVLHGSADRILKMAEREQKAAIALRKLDWTAQFISMLLGKAFLYFLVAATVYLIIKGKSVEALLTGIAPVVSVIYSTFFGSRKQAKEDE
jgi:uncharacterized membrane protein